jgi:hypothetical protein
MQCGDLISRTICIYIYASPHKGAKRLGHVILLICPEEYISMCLSTYILVCKIQKLFIYEDL